MKEEQEILSKFELLKKNTPYIVPENYFETILTKIQERTLESEINLKNKAGFLTAKPVLTLSFYGIGIFFIIFISLKMILPFWQKPNDIANSRDSIALFLDNQVFSLDDASLASEIEYPDLKITTNNNNDIINYLMNNNVEIPEIINEL